jgi:hypothetical protein
MPIEERIRRPSEASPHAGPMTEPRTWSNDSRAIAKHSCSVCDDHHPHGRNRPPQNFSLGAGFEGRGFKGNVAVTSEWRPTVELIIRALFRALIMWLLLGDPGLRQAPPAAPPGPQTSAGPSAPTETPEQCQGGAALGPAPCFSEPPSVRENRDRTKADRAPARDRPLRPEQRSRQRLERCYPAPGHRAQSPPCCQRGTKMDRADGS